eukprot:9062123-Pyramimonas_sp.AAC.1
MIRGRRNITPSTRQGARARSPGASPVPPAAAEGPRRCRRAGGHLSPAWRRRTPRPPPGPALRP